MPVKKVTPSMFVMLPLRWSLTLGGCTTILSETNDRPIESDPGARSFGSVIDDQIDRDHGHRQYP